MSLTKEWTIYLLECVKNRYYVGKTKQLPSDRFLDHLRGNGSAWTARFPPIKILETFPKCDSLDEDKYTEKFMFQYGINNVRGGSYTSIEPFKSYEVKRLEDKFRSAYDLCRGCGSPNHWYAECHKNKNPRYKKCTRCNRINHTIDNCYANTYQLDDGSTYQLISDDTLQYLDLLLPPLLPLSSQARFPLIASSGNKKVSSKQFLEEDINLNATDSPLSECEYKECSVEESVIHSYNITEVKNEIILNSKSDYLQTKFTNHMMQLLNIWIPNKQVLLLYSANKNFNLIDNSLYYCITEDSLFKIDGGIITIFPFKSIIKTKVQTYMFIWHYLYCNMSNGEQITLLFNNYSAAIEFCDILTTFSL